MDSPHERNPSVLSSRDRNVLELFGRITDRAAAVVASNTEWGPSGARSGQYAIDLDVDEVCVRPLLEAGFDVLSEESGLQTSPAGGHSGTVVVDPLDGSTNASIGLPWFATALCLVIEGELSVAMVTNLATGERYTAVKDRGADRNGLPILVAKASPLDDSIIAVNGMPNAHWGWRQFRAMGAAALDICTVGRGGFDGYVDATVDSHGVWDYLAGVLIVREAGGVAVDAHGRDLLVLDHTERRTPVVANSPELLAELLAARNA